ncbi:unnamed protein product [Closterium sp. Yama58-4]|nr:unnamed protein product [Closterium sp. Yama58-4]
MRSCVIVTKSFDQERSLGSDALLIFPATPGFGVDGGSNFVSQLNVSAADEHSKYLKKVHWWRAQATRFMLRWPSAYLCHIINRERHHVYGMHVARQVLASQMDQKGLLGESRGLENKQPAEEVGGFGGRGGHSEERQLLGSQVEQRSMLAESWGLTFESTQKSRGGHSEEQQLLGSQVKQRSMLAESWGLTFESTQKSRGGHSEEQQLLGSQVKQRSMLAELWGRDKPSGLLQKASKRFIGDFEEQEKLDLGPSSSSSSASEAALPSPPASAASGAKETNQDRGSLVTNQDRGDRVTSQNREDVTFSSGAALRQRGPGLGTTAWPKLGYQGCSLGSATVAFNSSSSSRSRGLGDLEGEQYGWDPYLANYVGVGGDPYVPRPIISVHVRQGDKSFEMRLFSFYAVMFMANRVRRENPSMRYVWLSTEMQSVVDQSNRFTDWTFFYSEPVAMIPPAAMDPEMVRLAQEQMSRMSPQDIQRMQQMMTPDMIRLATEQMGRMSPEDMRRAAEQMKHLSPQQIASAMGAGAGAGGGIPGAAGGGGGGVGGAVGGLPDVASYMSQRQQYELNAATMLKNEGNKLHGMGKYSEAAEKYNRARDNLAMHSSPAAVSLRRTCAVNLMSCHLKTNAFAHAVSVGTQVISEDGSNLKALYRRGLAYKELGQLKEAVADLSKAAQISPDDETLAGVLRGDDDKHGFGSSGDTSYIPPSIPSPLPFQQHAGDDDEHGSSSSGGDTPRSSPLNTPPSNMQAMMTSMDPAAVAALSGGALSPEMARTAAQLVGSMSPEDLQKMMRLASTFSQAGGGVAGGMGGGVAAGTGGAGGAGAAGGTGAGRAAGGVGSSGAGSGRRGSSSDDFDPVLTPTTGSASSRSTGNAAPAAPAAAAVTETTYGMPPGFGREVEAAGEAAGGGGFSGGGMGAAGMPAPGVGGGLDPMQLQERLLNDPSTVKLMSDMMQQLSAEDIAAMSSRMGQNMSVEQAEQAKRMMQGLGPERLATVMKFAQKAQTAAARFREAVRWLLQRPVLLASIIILVIAVFIHYMGWFS